MLRFDFTLPHEDCNLFLISDDHEGSANRHKNGWDMMVDMVTSRWDGLPISQNKVIDHGDFMEAILINDFRYQSNNVEVYEDVLNDGVRFNESNIKTKRQVKKDNAMAQLDQAVKNRMPIAEHMLMILDGNHPQRLHAYGDLTAELCRQLGVNYGTYTSHITYRIPARWGFNDQFAFNHYVGHGWKSVNSVVEPPERAKVNMQIALKNHLKAQAGDCLLMSMGHTHKLIVKKPISQLYIEGQGDEVIQKYTSAKKHDGFIHPDYRWFVNTGSFLKLYGPESGYAERAGYPPNELGFAVVQIRGGDIQAVKRLVVGSTGLIVFDD